MNKVNRVRVLIGGVVAGLIVFGLMGLANHLFLQNDWNQWMVKMGPLAPPPTHKTMLMWLLESLVVGITGTAIYAGIRPRYGAGPATALWAGCLTWLLTYATAMFNDTAMNILPEAVIHGEFLAGLVASLAGIFVGAAIYKE